MFHPAQLERLWSNCFYRNENLSGYSFHSFPARKEKTKSKGVASHNLTFCNRRPLFLAKFSKILFGREPRPPKKILKPLRTKTCRKNARLCDSWIFPHFGFPHTPNPSPQGEGRRNPRPNKIVSTSRRLHFSVQFRVVVIVPAKMRLLKDCSNFFGLSDYPFCASVSICPFSKSVVRCV